MNDFWVKRKVKCRAEPLETFHGSYRIKKQLSTGSHYDGEWQLMGMNGYGEYTYENGVVYEGQFENGMMHGKGELRYTLKDGRIAVIRGRWKEDVLVERTLFLSDSLEYKEDGWTYCMMPDRRFAVEFDTGMKPAGQSYLTAEQPTKEIPPGFYDTGDGFFDPKTKAIFKDGSLRDIVRAPGVQEQKWIVANCRKGVEEPLGPRPDLYENLQGPVIFPVSHRPPTNTLKPKISEKFSKQSLLDKFDYDSAPVFYGADQIPDNDNSASGHN
ncbi:MORN repeat-containing protein 5-like [Spodoptera litura]|uniref:MORN repeat-containing protein 5 n=1 Tax=Spodoptera litura TaxID=69820 RepID=A0A9J7EIS7_SPOLT|nr:MORN repeat-containing protein 5-like [Spodoptera litura]